MSTCSTCGAPIRWAKTAAGKNIPLDPDPVPLGNLYLDEDGVAMTVTKDLGRSVARYVSHFATCPDADEHRKKEEPEAAEPDPESDDPYLWGSGT